MRDDPDRSAGTIANWTDDRREVIPKDGKDVYRKEREGADGTETGDGRPGNLGDAGRRGL